jgi:hypothetical protein
MRKKITEKDKGEGKCLPNKSDLGTHEFVLERRFN